VFSGSYAVRQYDRERVASWRGLGVSRLVTPPADELISVETLIRHARLPEESDHRYDIWPARIQAARLWAEEYTGRAFLTQTWSLTVDRVYDGNVPLILPRSPLIDVTSVKVYDTEDAETTVSTSNYRVDTTTEPGRLLLTTSAGSWGSSYRPYGALQVIYRAGYGATEDLVPAPIRQAVLLLATEFNERLEAASEFDVREVPFGIRVVLDQYKVWG
jgi:uncharacterized phiE125 gp8 family phage protein